LKTDRRTCESSYRSSRPELKNESGKSRSIGEETELNTTIECGSEDIYKEELRQEMEVVEKYKNRQDKILYQQEVRKERKL
jgi:hypothetical protein